MVKYISSNKVFKILNYQTESNKFYSILVERDFDKEKGVKLNPYSNSEDILDNEVIVIKEKKINETPSFNIINTDLGIFLEVYSLGKTDVYIVDKVFELEMLLELVKKLSKYNFDSTIKFLKMKYGFKDMYLIRHS